MTKYLRNTLALLGATLFALPSFAADIYVRDGGNGSGSSWSDALDQIPTLTANNRGDTVWVADGTYSGFSISFSDSSTQRITVKKATGAEHGSNTGWNTSYGDGRANLGRVTLRANYITLDGSVGGGPGNWRNGHGFVINAGSTPAGYGIRIHEGGRSIDHVTVDHVEVYHGTPTGSQDGIYLRGDNFILRNSWVHDTGRVGLAILDGENGSDNGLVEYSVIEKNGRYSSDGEHSELVAMIWDADNWTFRYNEFADFRSTGGIIMWGTVSNIRAYGNVFRYTGWYTGTGGANGLFGGQSSSPGKNPKEGVNFNNIHFYNNTCVGFNRQGNTAGNVFSQGSNPDITVRNNLFYNCNSPSVNGNHDYNHYINSGTEHTEEPNGTTGSGDPFVNSAAGDFRLKAGTAPGQNIGAPYNKDAFGNVRGSDGTLDRGAYDFGSGPAPDPDPNPIVTPEHPPGWQLED